MNPKLWPNWLHYLMFVVVFLLGMLTVWAWQVSPFWTIVFLVFLAYTPVFFREEIKSLRGKDGSR